MPTTAASKSASFREGLDRIIQRERLPAGLADLAEPLIARSQRERILVAMADSCAAKGFAATTIGDIVDRAGVSRATFYELFRDKEDCLQAAMEVAMADAMGRLVGSYSPDRPWAESVRTAVAELLELFASRPAFARMALVEAPSAGGRAFDLYASAKRVLQAVLERGRDDPVEEEAIPSSASRAALAAAESLIVGRILAGGAERLPELLPDILYIVTVPYLGQEEALRRSREAEQEAREPS